MEKSKSLVIYQKVDRTSSAIEQIKIRHDRNICNNKTTGHQSVSSDLIGIFFMTYFLCHSTFFSRNEFSILRRFMGLECHRYFSSRRSVINFYLKMLYRVLLDTGGNRLHNFISSVQNDFRVQSQFMCQRVTVM